MKRPAIWILSLYKFLVSPFLPPSCRFYPTCSDYARDAIENHGAAKGTLYAIRRLSKCHSLNPGGYDPAPSSKDEGDVFVGGTLL